MIRFFSLVSLVLVMIGLSHTSSAITDNKLMSATACNYNPSSNRVAPAAGTQVPPPYYYTADGSVSTTTGYIYPYDASITMECPVLRDYTTNLDGLLDFRVNVSDSDSANTVQCRVGSWSADHIQGLQSALQQSGITFSGGYKQLTFGTSLNVSWSGGTYTLTCDIGPNTYLRSYYVTERTGADTN